LLASPVDFEACPRDLFGRDLCATPGWYEATVEAALPPGGKAKFVQVLEGGEPIAIFPMLQTGKAWASLCTPYTILWRPLLAPGLDAERIAAAGAAFGAFCKRHGAIRLDAIDQEAPWVAPIAEGIARAGLRILPFDHFGNWQTDLRGLDWAGYLAARPGKLREAIRRRSAKLMREDGAVLTVTEGGAGLDQAIAAFEAVYAKSWKEPEPSPAFNATLARACAKEGSLRLGVLSLGEAVLAAQFWVVTRGTATVLKLAHDEAAKALSPGTVLTALMIRRLMVQDRVTTLDFGRGDDEYKQLWTDTRRQRIGWMIANPLSVAGAGAVLVGLAGKARKSSFSRKRSKKLLSSQAFAELTGTSKPAGLKERKFFGSFFQKRTACFTRPASAESSQ